MWGRTALPEATGFGSLVDILDFAVEHYGDDALMSLQTDERLELTWSARELDRRSRLVAWRLRGLGLQPGDRLLTWAPPGPDLAAVYFGAMRAGVTLVPLDLRMTHEVVRRIADRAETQWLAIGSGRDAPQVGEAGLAHFQTRTVHFLTGEPSHESASGADEGDVDADFPRDWEERLAAWAHPVREDLLEIVFTSGTTGQPKGVMLTHGNVLATMEAANRIIPAWQHRIVSLLPLSHLFGQLELVYAVMLGAPILYLRSRNPRIIFLAIRKHRVTTMVVVPQLLDLFWRGITREVDKQGRTKTFDRLRSVARHIPYWLRRLIFRRVHAQLGGQLRLFICSAAFLPPPLQQSWEDMGVIVLQGYGTTESGFATANSIKSHPPGVVGRPVPPNEVRLASPENEILLRGPAVFQGYWHDAEATAAALDNDRSYHTGDVGHFDRRGNLVLSGRIKDMIVLPNGLNVFPEDIEKALQVAGLREPVVLETAPGRIEAVILHPDAAYPGQPTSDASDEAGVGAGEPTLSPEQRAVVDVAVKSANTQLGIHQRVEGWSLWPEADYPRTHTLKVRRDLVRKRFGGLAAGGSAVGGEPAGAAAREA